MNRMTSTNTTRSKFDDLYSLENNYTILREEELERVTAGPSPPVLGGVVRFLLYKSRF
jgi:hypothetical protein